MKYTHSSFSFLLNSSRFTISWATIWSGGDAVVYEKSKDEVNNKIFFNDLDLQTTKAKESKHINTIVKLVSSYSRILLQAIKKLLIVFSLLSHDSNMQLIKKNWIS